MGSSTSREISNIMKVGERDFPTRLLESICDAEQGNQKLVLSMRAAGLLGSLVDQLSRFHPLENDRMEMGTSETHTILLSDGNSYHIDGDFFRNYSRLRTTLANIRELLVNHSDGRTLQDYLDLSPFSSVLSLTLIDVPVHLVHYLKLLRPTLQSLRVHRCVDSLKKLFESCGGDQSFPALWTRLAMVDLRWNNLTAVDDSMQLLPFLHTLDLSYNRLTDVRGLECLTAIKVLNLSYNCLKSMPPLMVDCRNNLQVLLMRFNRISSLEGADGFTGLRRLDVSNNSITKHSELRKLKSLRFLAKLDVQHNPFMVIERVKRRHLLENLNTLVPIDFELNGRMLSSRENYVLRKVPVSRMPASNTPVSSLVQANPLHLGAHTHINGGSPTPDQSAEPIPSWMEASQDSTRREVTTGGSEADVSSSDAEGYLANSLTALARQTRHHLDHVRGRYGKNWLVNWNQSEMGRNIPSPPSTVLRTWVEPEGSSTPRRPAEETEPAEERCEASTSTKTAVGERLVEEEEEEQEPEQEPEEESRAASVAISEEPQEPREHEEPRELREVNGRGMEESSSSQLYVTALSELEVSPRASPMLRDGHEPTEVYPLKWEHDDEETTDLTVDGTHFVVTQLETGDSAASGRGQQRMLVVGNRHCQTSCLTSGRVIETLELRLLTSVRREADGRTLFLGFRYAHPGQRSRGYRFSEAADCESCHALFAAQLMSDPIPSPKSSAAAIVASAGVGVGVTVPEPRAATMHCFRCRNKVQADQVARVMEVEPSTGERVLVPACPFCGFRALAEDSDEEGHRSAPMQANGRSPRSAASSGSGKSQKSVDKVSEETNGRHHAAFSPRLSASGYSSPSALRLVSCDWIRFDHSDFTEFDHQIKLHFALHVLQSDKEECRIMIKCHGTPYNRSDVFECVVLFTNQKYYFFKWKFHESQTVAKCLTLTDKIDLRNLIRIRSGPCFQWLMLDFKNSKRCLLFPGDPESGCQFINQLSEALEFPVVDFESEENQRRDFCSHSLSDLDQDSGEQILAHLYVSQSEEDEDLSSSVRMWMCRCPRSKYVSGPPLTSLSVWTGRESKRDWCLLILTNIHLMLFDVDYTIGMENPTAKLVYKWSITDVSGLKQGRDGLTLVLTFFRNRSGEEKDVKYKHLPVVFENDEAVRHFFGHFQKLWEQFYGVPLKMK